MVKANQTLNVKPEQLVKTLQNVKKDFEFPLGVTAVHFPPKIEVTYQNISLKHPYISLVKTTVPDNKPELETSAKIFPGNQAHEAEVYDLMGVNFLGHKNLNRILLPNDFEGHPLRKDYQ
jgi:NADH-quinone oxidoreductase subunit C